MKRLLLLACVCLSAVAQGPDLARDLINKGYEAIQRGDGPGAISRFEDALRLAPANAQAWKQLGYLYLAAGDRLAALDAFNRTLEASPSDLETALQRGFLLRSLGRTALARTAFRQMAESASQPFAKRAGAALEQIAAAPDPADAALSRAYAALSEQDYDQAIAGFRTALAAGPERPEIEKQLAYALLKTGNTYEARNAMERAVALDRTDEHAALELAFLRHETGQQAEAFAGFQVLSQAQDDSVQTLAAATAKQLETELDDAIRRWVQVIAEDPRNRSVRLELADLYEKRNQPAQAAEQYLVGWSLPGPDGDEVLVKLGRARAKAGSYTAAHGAWLLATLSEETRVAETARSLLPERFPWADEFRAALAIDFRRVELRRALAYLLLEVDLVAQAMTEFETILRLQPNDYQSAAQLAFLYQDAGDYERAGALLAQAQESDDPEVVQRAREQLWRILDERSRPLHELGDKSLEKSYLQDARRLFAQAYSANPADYAAALKLGVVHNLMQQDREAIEWFRIAAASDDPSISEQASRSYANLAPQFRFARTTLWAFPFYSHRFQTVFGYAQAKTEFRLGSSPIKPYVSLRLAGDARRRAGGAASPSFLSESSLIAAVGARTQLGRGMTLWGEAGQSFSYLSERPRGVPRVGPDYRGGVNWLRSGGATLAGDEAGAFWETNLDGVYLSRFHNDLLAYWRLRTGYRLPNRGPLRSQVYWNWNVTADTLGDYWGNYVETGPGITIRLPSVAPPVDFSLNLLRGVHLSNRGNLNRPNYFDLRVGVWYSFTR